MVRADVHDDGVQREDVNVEILRGHANAVGIFLRAWLGIQLHDTAMAEICPRVMTSFAAVGSK